ncbi:uncharacterized protein LOC117299123 [Asterias rubens]|uniref:uncharacterized protein LOC117299123 n=1 Tax=Asterias rubens TaxID=7604 RepID=UPI0014555DA2|nr:uncharacterized protein LOC117299123 [Asterias rubens]
MVAFVNAGGHFTGVSATPLQERFGVRTVVTVSGLVAGVSMITASFLSSLYTITFILTVFAGLLYDLAGDYIVAFSLMAGVQSLTVVAALGLSWRQKHHPSSSEASK